MIGTAAPPFILLSLCIPLLVCLALTCFICCYRRCMVRNLTPPPSLPCSELAEMNERRHPYLRIRKKKEMKEALGWVNSLK